ncbi:MAG: MMPL family transporter [Phycisphaeraceae bacterium]|nr:MMPL family transporter [Phycisphaeraceae bacterium]
MSRASTRTDSGHIGDLAARLAGWSATRPGWVLAGAVVVLAFSLVSLSRLHITSSLTGILGSGSGAAAAMERVVSGYRSGAELMLLVELPEGRAADDAGRAELVGYATRLASALGSDPVASRLVLWARFREDPELLRFAREVMLPHGVFYLSEGAVEELERRLQPAQIRRQIARNEAMISAPGAAGAALSEGVLRDPLRLFDLVPPELRSDVAADAPVVGKPELSDDGRAILLSIGTVGDGGDYEAAGRTVDAVERLAAKTNSTGLSVAMAGSAAIARETSRVIRRDSIVSVLASVALLYALFFLFYSRWSAGLVIGGVAAVGMLAGVGAVAVVVREVSPLAAMIAALLAGIGADYGVHFLSRYDGYRGEGQGSAAASVETARHMAVPIGTNCFTSIFGFMSLWPSTIKMLSDFAVMGAAGLLGAFLAVFVLMPAVLAVTDRRETHRAAGRAMFNRFADGVVDRPRTCMGLSLAILGAGVVAAAAQGFSIGFESDLTVMHPRPSKALDATSEVMRRFSRQGALVPIEVRAAAADQLVGVAHDAARALTSPACREAGVTAVLGLGTLLPDPRQTAGRLRMLDRLDPSRVIEAFDAAIAESQFEPKAYAGYRGVLAEILGSRRVPTVADVMRYRSVAERVFPAASLVGGGQPTSTMLVVRLAEPLHDREQRRHTIAALRKAASGVRGGEVTVAGIDAVSEELDAAARVGLPRAIAISFGLVLLWLMIVFRRAVDVLLALLPLAFAAVATVAFIVATRQLFNPINTVAIPLLGGIAVDAGVFLVSVFRSDGATRAELRPHLRPTVHAISLSVGTTATAFGSLCISHTPAIQSLGLVSAVGIMASGVGSLLLLMPILIRRAPRAGVRGRSEPCAS